MNISKSLTILALLLTPLASHAYYGNYIEYGFGAAQLHSTNTDENNYLSNYSLGTSAKVLLGGRISRSTNSWFELGATYSNGIKYRDTTINYSQLFMGLKFTTDLRNKVSSFLKIGGGKTFASLSTVGSNREENNYLHAYLGTGVGYRLNTKQSINVEAQRSDRQGGEIGFNSFVISFNHLI